MSITWNTGSAAERFRHNVRLSLHRHNVKLKKKKRKKEKSFKHQAASVQK